MKVKEYKNKIIITELDPDADYIMLFNPAFVRDINTFLKEATISKSKIYLLAVSDVDKAVKFVEIPKKL